MKICFVSFFAYPLFNVNCSVTFGGAEVQLFNLAQSIKNKYEVSFIVGNFGQKKQEIYNNVKVFKSVRLGSKYGLFKKIKSVLIQLFVMRESNADIYIKRAAGPEVGIIALYCMLFRKKFVYMTAGEIDCSGEYRRKNKFLGLLYEFGLKHADTLITQSKDHQRLLKDTYGLESFILNTGYNIPKSGSGSKEYILWVARLDKCKQPEIFLDLAKMFPEESFVMIAPASSDLAYAQKIQRKAKDVRNMQFISGVPFFKIDEYFKNAKIFINTSHYEGFPNTFVQAAMHGIPIVSLNVNPDLIFEKNNIGYYANNNPNVLAGKVKLLINEKNIYNKISANAHTYAVENHDLRKTQNNFLCILDKISKNII